MQLGKLRRICDPSTHTYSPRIRSSRRCRSFLNHALLIKVAAVQLSFIMCSAVVSWIYAFYVAFGVRNDVVMSLTNGFSYMLYSLSNLGMSSVIQGWMFPREDDVISREIFHWNFVRLCWVLSSRMNYKFSVRNALDYNPPLRRVSNKISNDMWIIQNGHSSDELWSFQSNRE